jgi:hypothetical protein
MAPGIYNGPNFGSADQPLFNSLMEQHHYFAYEQAVVSTSPIWAGRRADSSPAWQ